MARGGYRDCGELLSLNGEFAPLALDLERDRPLSGSPWSGEEAREELRVRERPRLSLRLSEPDREPDRMTDEDVAEPETGETHAERPRGDISGERSPACRTGESGGERIRIYSSWWAGLIPGVGIASVGDEGTSVGASDPSEDGEDGEGDRQPLSDLKEAMRGLTLG